MAAPPGSRMLPIGAEQRAGGRGFAQALPAVGRIRRQRGPECQPPIWRAARAPRRSAAPRRASRDLNSLRARSASLSFGSSKLFHQVAQFRGVFGDARSPAAAPRRAVPPAPAERRSRGPTNVPASAGSGARSSVRPCRRQAARPPRRRLQRLQIRGARLISWRSLHAVAERPSRSRQGQCREQRQGPQIGPQ